MTNRLFIDTGFALSLAFAPNIHYAKAMELEQEILRQHAHLVTTHAVLTEIGNALSREKYRSAAARLLHGFENNPMVDIVPVTSDLYAKAFTLYRQRPDKRWGMTDCISFVVMHEQGITEALAHDINFEQAGFTALLR